MQAVWRGPRCVFWLWGQAGTGKSRTAFEYGGLPFEPLRPGKGTVWWDGYAGQEVILFDDIREGQVDAHDFLRWCDGRDFIGSVKGGSIGIEAHTWIFTSNLHWRHIWPAEDSSLTGPIGRRITLSVEYKVGMRPVEIKCPHNGDSVTSYTDGPGNTLPVHRNLEEKEAAVTPTQSDSGRTPQELQRLLDAIDREVFDFCDKHGMYQCSACDPAWGSSLLK